MKKSKKECCAKTRKALQIQGREGGPTKMAPVDPMRLHKGKYKGTR